MAQGVTLLAFKNKGYRVDAIDYSEVLVERASQLTGMAVQQQSFYELDMHDVYDGVWACASLLHCARNRLPDVLKRIHAALRRGGVCYMSFKYGQQIRSKRRSGRLLTEMKCRLRNCSDQLSGVRVFKQ